MFETRSGAQRVVLQVLLTILVLPFLFPLIVMVQGSLEGEGWRPASIRFAKTTGFESPPSYSTQPVNPSPFA